MSSATSNHPTRKPTADEQSIIDRVLLLYQCKPSEHAYSIYADDAVFHDPVSIAQGKKSIMSQFNGMPKIFERSDTVKCDVLDHDGSSAASAGAGTGAAAAGTTTDLKLDLTQHYVFKVGGAEKTLNSLVTLKRDAQGLVKQHDEEWDHKKNTTGDDGFFGKINELRKKFMASVIDSTVTSDPSKV
ncbi:hypothetical protein PYCC9005_004013 [Savitreella phatthalungensis]